MKLLAEGAGEARATRAYTRVDGAVYAAACATSAAIVALSLTLQPSAAGLGTHRQLGLPPCLFLSLTGWPCAGCGVTTSFAHMARLDFMAALSAQPFGAYLFALLLLSLPLALYLMRRRVPWLEAFELRAVRLALFVTPVVLLAGWAYKLTHF